MLALRWFRDRTGSVRLGCDHGVSCAYRYLDEVIGVLADEAPDLHEVVQQAHVNGLAYVILDGTVITSDRLTVKTTSVQGKNIDLAGDLRDGQPGFFGDFAVQCREQVGVCGFEFAGGQLPGAAAKVVGRAFE